MQKTKSKYRGIRRKLYQLHREYVALASFFGATKEEVTTINDEFQRIVSAGEREFRSFIGKLEVAIEMRRQKFEIRGPTSQFVEYLENAEQCPTGQRSLILKAAIRKYCDGYDLVLPTYDDLPSHARIAFNLGGTDGETHAIEVYLIECMMYEEMCAIFNSWIQQALAVKPHMANKVQNKLYCALSHATINAAFYFAEAFVNGIAAEYLLDTENIPSKERAALAEWDFDKDKPRFMNFREKVMQYPKIVLQCAHPPISESNCPEFKYLIETSTVHRDALVHPSAKPTEQGYIKEEIIMNPDEEVIKTTIDSAIGLARKLQAVVRPDKAIIWLIDRPASGEFPASVFY